MASSYNPSSISSYGPAPAGAPQFNNDFLNNLGFGNLIKTGQDVTQGLLNGNTSADAARTANAYFGTTSGMPGSDYVKYRGADLYGATRKADQQTGLGDLNTLLSGVTSPVLANQGQQFQNTQFNQNLNQNQNQFDQNLQLQQFLAQLQAMGLGQNIVNSGKNQPPPLYKF